MANEVVKYDTELNTIPLRKFTPIEMNLFFSIVSRMRDKDSQIVRFTFDQLKDLSAYKQTAGAVFVNDLERTYDHLMDLRFGRRSNGGRTVERFVMFTTFEIHGEAEVPYADIQIHPRALPLLNNLENWVRYSLIEFRELNSSYAKTMFRLLKQFRTLGKAYFSKDDFFELLDIPDSYSKQQANLDKRVITPIKEELSPIFQGLKVTKERSSKRGHPIIGYHFTFKPEPKNADDFNKGGENKRDLQKKLGNIEHNADLTDKEKYIAKDKLLGLKIGSSERLEKENNLKLGDIPTQEMGIEAYKTFTPEQLEQKKSLEKKLKELESISN